MKFALLALPLVALSALAQDSPVVQPTPVAAVAAAACGEMYGVTVLMSDGTWRHIPWQDIDANPRLQAALAKLNGAIAEIVDPKLCSCTST